MSSIAPGLRNQLADPERILAAARAGLRPDRNLTVSAWADEYRVLSSRSSPEPGPWRTSRVPFTKAIMDDLSPSSRCHTVVFMKGAQIAGTECGNNWIAFNIHHAPGPMMAVQPTVEMAKRNSKQRIGPLLEDCEVLRGLVKDSRSRDSGNTLSSKEFPGGILVMTGANSATGLRSMSARYLFLDEVDGYPGDVDGEGEPCALAMVRTTNYARRKIFIVSTPVISGRSRIERFYEESDQRQFWVPCPHCGELVVLKMAQLRWAKGRPQEAKYFCEACGKPIDNYQKTWMLARGEWIAQRDDADPGVHGYHLSSLYSPVGWLSWAQVATKREAAGNDQEKLQVFTNTVLGLPWSEPGEVPNTDRLYERRESYPIGTVPKGGSVLCAGVDVQIRRIEVEVVAYGRNKESWSVDYRVFDGETNQPAIWENVARMLDEDFPSENGRPMRIRRMAIDSGFNTMAVYDFVRKMPRSRVMAVKGESHVASLVGLPSLIEVGPQGRRVSYGIRLWPVNTFVAKEELYRFLRNAMPDIAAGEKWPTGYCHFPAYSKEYFEQLTAEHLVSRRHNGRSVLRWEKLRDRNEALDCFDAETEVLTDSGWSRFPELNGQKVATVELETDRIEFEQPTDFISRRHDGEMVHLQGRRLDILVTPNHRMVTYLPSRDENRANTPGITLARDLTQRHQLKLAAAKWTGSNQRCVSIPPSVTSDSGAEIEPQRYVSALDLAQFYGWWITEGSARTNYFEQSTRRVVCISQSKFGNCLDIADLLDRLPWRFNWNDQSKKFIATSKQLHDEVTQWGRLQTARRVPGWIKSASPNVIQAFLSAAVAGDGWTQTGDCRVIATTCEELAGDYQELFIKLGQAPRIHYRKAQPYTIRDRHGDNTLPQYHVHENAQVKRASLDGGSNGDRGYIGRSVPYDGQVYCATVPNGTLICRRRGQVFVAGNCRVYARAAAVSLRIDSWTEARWEDAAVGRGTPVAQGAPVVSPGSVMQAGTTRSTVPQFKPTRAREDWLE